MLKYGRSVIAGIREEIVSIGRRDIGGAEFPRIVDPVYCLTIRDHWAPEVKRGV